LAQVGFCGGAGLAARRIPCPVVAVVEPVKRGDRGYARRDSGRRRAGRSVRPPNPHRCRCPRTTPNGIQMDSIWIPNGFQMPVQYTRHPALRAGVPRRGRAARRGCATVGRLRAGLANAEVRKIKEKLKNRLRASESRQSRPIPYPEYQIGPVRASTALSGPVTGHACRRLGPVRIRVLCRSLAVTGAGLRRYAP